MAFIYLGLGSNIDPHRYISAALDALADNFGELLISSVYEAEAVGFEGDNFHNLVVGVRSELSVGEISRLLKQVEDQNGRDRSASRFGPRTLDIDILTIEGVSGVVDGIKLPRDEVLGNAFVLQPLAEVAPEMVHPGTHENYRYHWQCYNQHGQKLWPVAFVWRGKNLTSSSE